MHDHLMYARLDQSLRCGSWVMHPADSSKSREVKNLGWLLRHWQDVEYFAVRRIGARRRETCSCSVVLIAQLRDGRTYETHYADASILRDWLHRPVFIGLTVWWLGARTTIARDNGFGLRLPAWSDRSED
jgi:hypothetical protein